MAPSAAAMPVWGDGFADDTFAASTSMTDWALCSPDEYAVPFARLLPKAGVVPAVLVTHLEGCVAARAWRLSERDPAACSRRRLRSRVPCDSAAALHRGWFVEDGFISGYLRRLGWLRTAPDRSVAEAELLALLDFVLAGMQGGAVPPWSEELEAWFAFGSGIHPAYLWAESAISPARGYAAAWLGHLDRGRSALVPCAVAEYLLDAVLDPSPSLDRSLAAMAGPAANRRRIRRACEKRLAGHDPVVSTPTASGTARLSLLDAPAHPAIRRPAAQTRTHDVRVAYVVLAHSDPVLFGRLMHRLDDPRTAAFVHVDGKAAIEPFRRVVADLDRIHFVAPRLKVMWAGFSQVESTLLSLEAAIAATTRACSHVVVISGADYPLAGNDEILDFFAGNCGRQFIRRFSVMESRDARQMWRLRGRHFREWADRFTPQRKPLYALEQMLHLFPRRLPAATTFALGSNWVALTRECTIHCLERARRDRALVDFFRPAFGPDEMFLHTLVENSSFADEAEPIEPYVDITTIGGPFHYGNVHALTPTVPVRTAQEADAILRNRGRKLFTRKFSSAVSGAALDRLDAAADGRPACEVRR